MDQIISFVWEINGHVICCKELAHVKLSTYNVLGPTQPPILSRTKHQNSLHSMGEGKVRLIRTMVYPTVHDCGTTNCQGTSQKIHKQKKLNTSEYPRTVLHEYLHHSMEKIFSQ